MTITVKVGKVLGEIREYAVETGMTVQEVLNIANITSIEGYQVKMDSNPVQLSDVVTESSKMILLSKLLKGNQ